jgi:hypothetical protein
MRGVSIGAAFDQVVHQHAGRPHMVHPQRHLAGYTRILQADASAGFSELYAASRKPGPITEAAC